MKTKDFLLVLLLIFFCISCEKEHSCAELSWTDYNPVETVLCYNYHKQEVMKSHDGDTLKVYGWLFYNKYNQKPFNNDQLLTSNKDIIGEVNGSVIGQNCLELIVVSDTLMPENPYDSMLYISGIVSYSSSMPSGIDPVRLRVENKITKSIL